MATSLHCKLCVPCTRCGKVTSCRQCCNHRQIHIGLTRGQLQDLILRRCLSQILLDHAAHPQTPACPTDFVQWQSVGCEGFTQPTGNGARASAHLTVKVSQFPGLTE